MKYIINVSTNWAGEENTYKTDCDPKEIEDLCEELAYENFETFGGFNSIARDHDLDPLDLTEEQEDMIAEMESDYYFSSYEEFNGTDEEFNNLNYDLIQ